MASKRKIIAVGLISLILILAFALYVGLIPVLGASSVHFRLDSDSPITGISISLVPEPSQCLHGPICDPTGPQCNLPSNFCSSINTQSSTDNFTFRGVKEGHYWLEFEANLGNNASRGAVRGIFVEELSTYYVTANITAGLATTEMSITNTTSW